MGEQYAGQCDFSNLRDHYEHQAPELRQSFWDGLAFMRDQCPITRSDRHGGYWVLSRYADVRAVLLDSRSFSAASGVSVPRTANLPLLPPLETDLPEHREWRQILTPYFLPAAVAEHEPAIRAIAKEHFDRFIDRGACDFLAEFALPFPGAVFFNRFLDIEKEESLRVHSWTKLLGSRPGTPEAADANRKVNLWTRELIDRRRAEGRPRGDVVDALLDAEAKGLFPPDRIVTALSMLTLGGLDTTKVGLSNAVRALAASPALFARLAADPALIPAAIEEILRFESPTLGLSRVATCDVEIGGHLIRAGERVVLNWASANRDEAEFERADEIVLERADGQHLAFGGGIHHCLGAHLARLEMKVALEILVDSITDLRIAEGAILDYDVGFHRGLKALPLTFVPRTRG